jgi:hypothetical protein
MSNPGVPKVSAEIGFGCNKHGTDSSSRGAEVTKKLLLLGNLPLNLVFNFKWYSILKDPREFLPW